MPVAKINKLELYVHRAVLDEVTAAIQKTGRCEIIMREEEEAQKASSGRLQELDALLSEARFLLRFLEPYFTDPVSSIARAFGEKPSLSLKDLGDISRGTDIREISEEMHTLERRLVEIRAEVSQIEGLLVMLQKLKGLPYSLELISSGTASIKGIIGTVPVDQLDYLKLAVENQLGENGELFVADFGEKDKETWTALFYLKTLEPTVFEICSKNGMTRVEIPSSLKGHAVDEINKLQQRTEELSKEETIIQRNAQKAAFTHVPSIRALSDYWAVLRSRNEILDSGYYTDQVVVLQAWVPSDSVERVKTALSEYADLTEVITSEPLAEDEPPTILENPKWAFPFETLTKLYGAPKYDAIDPTPLLAPFFFIFFGMCLGDAGYGIIMVGFFLYFLKRFKKMPKGTRQFFVLFVLSGGAAIIVGALTGSWLGDMVEAFPFLHFLKPLKDLPVILNPMQDPMTFLAISLAFGVVQIFVGLVVALYDCIRKKDYIGAIGDQGGWLILLAGLLVLGGTISGKLPANLSMPGKILSISGAVILVLTQGREKESLVQKGISGVLSLYNVTAYLGDVLSYSRLLALGLATSAIAMIINMLSTLASAIPYIGWVMAIVLCVGGHMFSVAVNILGAFVHSLRLQYVEFFSKFYTGGGRSFKPLTYETRFISIQGTSEEKL
ncbi:MAG: V-type ATP synthase subunit I [Synergistales bacterium]|nr:V-type ATP synthase subunit I [Synergistales bacterium]